MSIGVSGYINAKNQKFLHRKIENFYKYDSLTGLLNRNGFNNEFEIYGHIAGDKAILMIAQALKKACPEDALVVRIGGDEMLAVLEGKIERELICEKIQNDLRLSGASYR